MTSPIIDFIEARLEEDQETAKAAQDLMELSWQMLPEGPEEENYSGEYRISNGLTVAGHVEEAKARHIVLHQPARVLREITAKRELVAVCKHAQETWDIVGDGFVILERAIHALAAVYSDHADFNPEWNPE